MTRRISEWLIPVAMVFIICLAAAGIVSGQKPAAPPPAIKMDFDPEAKVKVYIRENCNDPDKLEFVSIGKSISLAECLWYSEEFYGDDDDARRAAIAWLRFKDPGVAVIAKYRTANVIGAKVLVEEVYLLNQKGEITSTLKPKNFRTTPPKKAADPFTEGFLDQFPAGFSGDTPKAAPEPHFDKEPPEGEKSRKWVSADGKQTVEAIFLELREGYVFVRLADESVSYMPLANLRRTDQSYAKGRQRAVDKQPATPRSGE
jgi:hypothetical protein